MKTRLHDLLQRERSSRNRFLEVLTHRSPSRLRKNLPWILAGLLMAVSIADHWLLSARISQLEQMHQQTGAADHPTQ
ncbi:MAG: hypothetical protein AAF236_09895 [Verrucomicrobiota bacterium]